MHIPDGFLDAKVAVVTGALSAVAVGMSLRQIHRTLPRKKVPLMGLSAAFIFSAQMLNFPVAGGTSGHLVGGVLASVLLGPSAAVLVLTSVLTVQCFLFADGGLTALGANIFNMGVISSVGGYYFYRACWRMMPGRRGQITAIAFACWVATVVAAVACAGEISLSGHVAWSVAFPAMTFVHMLIGVGEAILTCLVIVAIGQSRPDLLESEPGMASPSGYPELLVYGSLIAIGLALFISPFASKWPDGLDHVALQLGFAGREAKTRLIPAPIADYRMPGVASPSVATSLAGVVGSAMAFLLGLMLARILVRDGEVVPSAAHEPPAPSL
jgi:cobalt/nickel transport system permease protein